MFFAVHLVEDTPAVLSFGKLCKGRGYMMSGPVEVRPCLTKDENQTFCRSENFARLVVPGFSSSSTTTSSSISPRHDRSISLEPAYTPSNDEASLDCSKGVAGNCYSVRQRLLTLFSFWN